MSTRSRLLVCALALGALHLGVACAGFFAPYDPAAQDREHPYAPPMRPHFVDAQGRLHLRRFSTRRHCEREPSIYMKRTGRARFL